MSFVLLVLVGETQAGSISKLFDPGRRHGLTIHFEAGGGETSISAEHPAWTTTKLNTTEDGAGWIFGLGYAPMDQLIIHATVRWFMFGDKAPVGLILGPFGPLLSDEHMMGVLGISFYFSRNAPSLFLEVGAGGGSFASPFDDDTFYTSYSGDGYIAAVGYEFTRHVHVKIERMWTSNEEIKWPAEGKWDCATTWVTLGLVCY